MPTMFAVAGLPGSGKSKLQKQRNIPDDAFFDDYHASSLGGSIAFEHAKHYANLEACLKAGKDCMFVEVANCWASRRRHLQSFMSRYPAYTIEWLCFEDNLPQCLTNVLLRNRPKMLDEIQLACNV